MRRSRIFRPLTKLVAATVVALGLAAVFAPASGLAEGCAPGISAGLGFVNQPPSCQGQALKQDWNSAKSLGHAGVDLAKGNPVAAIADVAVPPANDDNCSSPKECAQQGGQKLANGTVQQLGGSLAGLGGTPNLQANFFAPEFSVFVYLAAAIAVILLGIAVIDALIKQDFREVWRSLFVYLPLAAFGGVAFTYFANAVLGVIDTAASMIIQSVADKLPGFLGGVAAGVAAIGGPFGWFGVLIASLIVALFGILIWFELVLRSGALYLIALFVPLCLAAMIWPRQVQLGGRIVRAFFSVALSKIVIVATLALAVALVPLPGQPNFNPINAAFMSMGLIILASLAPFALYKLIPLVGESAGAGTGAVRSAATESLMLASGASSAGTLLGALRGNSGEPGARFATAGVGGSGGDSSGGGSGGGGGQGPRPTPPLRPSGSPRELPEGGGSENGPSQKPSDQPQLPRPSGPSEPAPESQRFQGTDPRQPPTNRFGPRTS